MRFRTILSGVLVCALALTAVFAVAASARVYKGRTAQKYPIKVAVNGGG